LVVSEQLANMEVRLASQRGRSRPRRWEPVHSLKDANGKDIGVTDLFEEARARLRWLIDYQATPERHAIMGSHWKKLATTQTGKSRPASISEAFDSYREAWSLSSDGRDRYDTYHTCLWAQMGKLAGERTGKGSPIRNAVDELATQLAASSDEAGGAPDFWADAAQGDLALTRAVLDMTKTKGIAAGQLLAAKKPYLRAFKHRSTVRERDSVLDHLRDLVDLMPDKRSAANLGTLLDALNG
jgi:hypothetical protein